MEGSMAVTPGVLPLPGKHAGEMELEEDYESPFDFEAGVNKSYLYLFPGGNVSPPGSPPLRKFGNDAFSQVPFAAVRPGPH